MKSKLVVFIVIVTFLATCLPADQNFKKGDKYLTGQVGLNSYAFPFGFSYGFGITAAIEIGITVMAYFWSDAFFSYTIVQPAADFFYHLLRLKLKFDLFVGASLGYSVFSSNSQYLGSYASTLFLSPVLGARYFFKNNWAVTLKLYFSITGDFNGIGALLGISKRL